MPEHGTLGTLTHPHIFWWRTRYFGGELDILLEKAIFWWRTRYFDEESGVYFGGELSYFAEHGLVRTSEEYKISPWKSVSARNFTIASN